MSSLSLRPCPHCGGSPEEKPMCISSLYFAVVCDGCSSIGPSRETEGEAIALWNLRLGDALAHWPKTQTSLPERDLETVAADSTQASSAEKANVDASLVIEQPPKEDKMDDEKTLVLSTLGGLAVMATILASGAAFPPVGIFAVSCLASTVTLKVLRSFSREPAKT